MKRLTTNAPKDNIETALNLFYIKDNETWVRGGGPAPDFKDVSLFDFTRSLVKAHIPTAEIPVNDNDFSAMMAEWLFDDADSAEGTIATLYTAAWAFAELRHRLMAYEDTNLMADEIKEKLRLLLFFEIYTEDVDVERFGNIMRAERDGRLVVLPCKVGDTVWIKNHKFAAEINSISIGGKDDPCFEWTEYDRGFDLTEAWDEGYFTEKEIGKTVFLTHEEAEAAIIREKLEAIPEVDPDEFDLMMIEEMKLEGGAE